MNACVTAKKKESSNMTDQNTSQPQEQQVSYQERAIAFTKHLAAGDFATARNFFSPEMLAAMSEDALGQLWAQLQVGLGPFKESKEAQVQSDEKYTVVLLRSYFEKDKVDLKLVFDISNKIAGLFVVPVSVLKWSPPSYANPQSFDEKEIRFGAAPWSLPGTLTLPKDVPSKRLR